MRPDSYTVILDLLNEVADFLEDYADADGGPDGYRPNKAMSLGLRVEEEIARLVASPSSSGPSHDTLREFLVCIERLHSGGAFDLTDSPMSYMANVKRLAAEARASLSATREKA
jgi:hypothetical protein